MRKEEKGQTFRAVLACLGQGSPIARKMADRHGPESGNRK